MNRMTPFFLVIFFAISATPQSLPAAANPSLTTVKAISGMQDDTDVILEGHIVKKIRSEHFMFRDATGEIEVEIDDDDLKGVELTPAAKIRIVGEVDRDHNSVTIDAEHVELVK